MKGQSTNSQIWFVVIESNSYLIAVIHSFCGEDNALLLRKHLQYLIKTTCQQQHDLLEYT